MMTADKQLAHALLDRVPAEQMIAAVRFLELLATAPVEDEEIGDEEEASVARSIEWFKHNKGIPFEQVVADLGFTMDQIRNHRLD